MSEAFRRPPTGQEGHLPPREVSLPPGGQNPITLEYQIYPPTIDTLVTGMPGTIEVASVIELSEASGRVAAGLFMTEG